MSSHKKHIIALGKLMRYAANKRLALTENAFATDDAFAKDALILNKEISKQLGIDIFQEETPDNIIRYEEELYKSITKYTSENIPVKLIDEDILDIRKNAQSIEPSYLINFKINDSSENYKPVYKQLDLSFPSLKTYIRTCDYGMVYPFPDNYINDLYFVTTKAKIKNKNRILLIILTHGNKVSHTFAHGAVKTWQTEKGKEKELSILWCFIFQLEQFHDYLSNPVNLFLYLLERYGLDESINKKTKRFFRHEFVPSVNPEKMDFLDHIQIPENKDLFLTNSNIRRTPLGTEVVNHFTIRISEYLRDVFNFKI